MISKIKRIRGGWAFVAGLLVAMLLVPSVAVAAGLTFTGIEGVSKNKADVTPAGQLLTTQATPAFDFTCSEEFTPGQSQGMYLSDCNIPEGFVPIITTLQIDAFSVLSPGAGDYVIITVDNQTPSTYYQIADVNPANVGDTVIPLSPGIPTVENGNSQGLPQALITVSDISVTVILSGYEVLCADYSAYCP
jgi:hypothetical protein